MKDKIIKCDICEKILQIGGQKYKKKFGITWTFAVSIGGWGSREDLPSFTGEVCEECYEVWDEMIGSFNKKILWNRKGINKQDIKIV